MRHCEQLDSFVQQGVVIQFELISEMRASKRWLSIPKLSALHPYLQQQILLHWLCSEQLSFTPSETFFAEIFRFLQQPRGGSHTLYAWKMTKKQSWAMIE